MHKKICEIWKKEFEAKHPSRLTCSEKCAKELHRIRNRGYKRPKKVVNKISNAKFIDEDARETKKLGVRYGVYMAMKHMRGDKV